MEEEVIDVSDVLNLSNDNELFDSSLLDSLNKLTDEIHEDLLSSSGDDDDDDDKSDGSGDYYDSDEYTDDDEDPDSGENHLFNMMDDLVMELKMELKEEEPKEKELADAVSVESSNEKEPEPLEPTTIPEIVDEHKQTHEVEEIPVLPDPPAPASSIPPTDRSNIAMTEAERIEKQRRLHLQVKVLLQRVAVMAQEAGQEQSNHQVPGQRPRGDSSADKLEQLLGALSSYSRPTETAAVPQPTPQMSEGQAKTARAMSSYTQRKRREYLLRKQRAAQGGAAAAAQSQQSTAQKPSSARSIQSASSATSTSTATARPSTQKTKTKKQRTNKHKKRKPRVVSPDSSGNPNAFSSSQHQQHPDGADTMSQQSLHALLASLVDLDQRLSREQMIC